MMWSELQKLPPDGQVQIRLAGDMAYFEAKSKFGGKWYAMGGPLSEIVAEGDRFTAESRIRAAVAMAKNE